LRRPPGSTLFPYTTLFRSAERSCCDFRPILYYTGPRNEEWGTVRKLDIFNHIWPKAFQQRLEQVSKIVDITKRSNDIPMMTDLRSEEHTSELQSRENLVCR